MTELMRPLLQWAIKQLVEETSPMPLIVVKKGRCKIIMGFMIMRKHIG